METPEEQNEVVETAPGGVEEKEMSLEEFYTNLEEQEKNFKQETTTEASTLNSVNLDEATFEKIKSESGVEQELQAVDKETEELINKTKLATNFNSEISSTDAYMEKSTNEGKKDLEINVESNEIFSTQDSLDKIKNLSDQMSKNPIIYYSYGHWTEKNKEEKEKAQKELDEIREQISPLRDKVIEELKIIAENNPEKYRSFDSLKIIAFGQGLKNIPTSFENEYVNNRGIKIKKQNSQEGMPEVNPGIGSVGMWMTENGRINGKIKSGRIGGPFEIETNQGLVHVNKLYR